MENKSNENVGRWVERNETMRALAEEVHVDMNLEVQVAAKCAKALLDGADKETCGGHGGKWS